LEECVGYSRRLNVGSMIDVLTDGYTFREFCHSTEVVAVPMRRDQVVDLLQFGIFCRSHDALGITNRSGSGVPRIDEKRLALRCYEQGCIAALDVDHINVERFSRLSRQRCGDAD